MHGATAPGHVLGHSYIDADQWCHRRSSPRGSGAGARTPRRAFERTRHTTIGTSVRRWPGPVEQEQSHSPLSARPPRDHGHLHPADKGPRQRMRYGRFRHVRRDRPAQRSPRVARTRARLGPSWCRGGPPRRSRSLAVGARAGAWGAVPAFRAVHAAGHTLQGAATAWCPCRACGPVKHAPRRHRDQPAQLLPPETSTPASCLPGA
jgi:hypothetical protein